MLVKNAWFRLASGIQYVWHAKSSYYIHSPFVFNLLTNVINRRIEPSEFQKLNSIRSELINNNDKIEIEAVGTSSVTTKAFVSSIAKRYSVSSKYGRLLYNLVNHFQPSTILETGTGLGLSAANMALGNSHATVHTIDAISSLSNVAKQTLNNHNIHNVVFHNGQLDEVLEKICKDIQPIDAAYLDANHTYDATLRYFNILQPYLTTKAFVVIDDIHWSKDMNRAWKKLCQHESVTLSLDFYRMGVLFLNPDLSRENFQLYY